MNKNNGTMMGKLTLLTFAGAVRIPMSLEEYLRAVEGFDAIQSEEGAEDWFSGVDAEGMPYHVRFGARTVGVTFEADRPKYDETAERLLIHYAGGLEPIELPRESALALLGDGSSRFRPHHSPILKGTDVSGNPFRLVLRPQGSGVSGLHSLCVETRQERGGERSRC